MIRNAPPDSITWEFFIAEFTKQYVGCIYLSNMRREFHNLKQRQMSVTEYQRKDKQVCSSDASYRGRKVS